MTKISSTLSHPRFLGLLRLLIFTYPSTYSFSSLLISAERDSGSLNSRLNVQMRVISFGHVDKSLIYVLDRNTINIWLTLISTLPLSYESNNLMSVEI